MFWAAGCCRQTALGGWGGAAGHCVPKLSPGLSDQQGGVLARARGGHTKGDSKGEFKFPVCWTRKAFDPGVPSCWGGRNAQRAGVWVEASRSLCFGHLQVSGWFGTAEKRGCTGRHVLFSRASASGSTTRWVCARARGKRPHKGGERRPSVLAQSTLEASERGAARSGVAGWRPQVQCEAQGCVQAPATAIWRALGAVAY